MAGLNITVRTDMNVELARALVSASTKAEHIVAQQIAKDTEPFVPALEKSLSNHTKVVGGQVIYPGPYARFLYYGKLMIDPDTGSAWARKGATKVVTGKDLNIKKSVHNQAQSHWFEASKAQNIEKWIRVAERAVKNGLHKR